MSADQMVAVPLSLGITCYFLLPFCMKIALYNLNLKVVVFLEFSLAASSSHIVFRNACTFKPTTIRFSVALPSIVM